MTAPRATITKQMSTETGHRLSDYDGKCSHFHGHSYLWQVTATSNDLTANGMVVDFKDLKKVMQDVLDPLDHAMVLWRNDPLVKSMPLIDLNEIFRATNGAVPRLIITGYNPTAENFALYYGRMISEQLAAINIILVSVKLWETATSYAEVNF